MAICILIYENINSLVILFLKKNEYGVLNTGEDSVF